MPPDTNDCKASVESNNPLHVSSTEEATNATEESKQVGRDGTCVNGPFQATSHVGNSASLDEPDQVSSPLDPRAILEASLEFERSHPKPPLPMPMPIGVATLSDQYRKVSTSSASLYPSMESISLAASEDLAVEQSWDAASVPKKRPAAVPSTAGGTSDSSRWNAIVGPRSGAVARSAAGSRRTVTVSSLGDALGNEETSLWTATRMPDDSNSSNRHSSNFNSTSSLHYDDTSHAASLYAATATALSGSSKVPSVPFATAAASSATYTEDDDDDNAMKQAKIAAYYGLGGEDDSEMRRAKMAAYYGGNTSAASPAHSSSAVATPLADSTDGSMMPPVTAAAATIVDYETTVPFGEDDNEEHVVQAEFVCQSAYDTSNENREQHQQQQQQILQHQHVQHVRETLFPASTTATLFSEPASYVSPFSADANDSTGGGTTVATTEATVIESGPAGWSAGASEAVVLQGFDDIYGNCSYVDLDTKPPAVISSVDDVDTAATTGTLISPYQEDQTYRQNDDAVVTAHDTISEDGIGSAGAVATVVDYDVHPSEMMVESVQAEFVGSSSPNSDVDYIMSGDSLGIATTIVDYDVHPSEMSTGSAQAEFVGGGAWNADGHQNSVSVSSHHSFGGGAATTQTATAENVQYVNEVEEATEATVVDSGPMEKATAEAWSTGAAEEAQVLESNHDETVDAVAVGSDHFKPFAGATIQNHIGEAEVVDISDDIHPIEFASEDAATAELIGSDSNCAIAVPSESTQDHNVAEEAESTSAVFIEENSFGMRNPCATSAPQQAEVTLIATEQYEAEESSNQTVGVAHRSSSMSTIQEAATDSDNGVHEIQAAAVLGVEESNGNVDNEFYDYPQKPVSIATRHLSEPVRTSTQFHDIHGDTRAVSTDGLVELETTAELEWMRTPSFVGRREDESPRPISPPVVTATLVDDDYDGSIPPPIPRPRTPEMTTSTTSRTTSVGISRSGDATGSRREGTVPVVNSISNNIARGTSNVIEMLFGQSHCRKGISIEFDSLASSVLPRTLLPSSVIYSEATQSWVATVNTNQKALDGNNIEESSKALRAFSVPSKKQAICLARAWAPPRMHPFTSNPKCFICEAPFAVFRRACHCRNCGVCVCSSCAVQWPQKMLPATYNIKREGIVNVCKACDWLCSAFRLALLHGDADKAVALHSTGNLNLTTPFANVKGELFYPVHCAVLGGNLNLLKWLVDEHCCPLRSIRVSSGRQKDTNGSYTPILTSKGRSLLTIALGNRNIGIVRYLVVEKRMLLWAEKDLSIETLVQNLDLVLRILPVDVLGEQSYDQGREGAPGAPSNNSLTGSTAFESTNSSLLGATTDEDLLAIRASLEMDGELGSSHDECIICFSNPIDCVNTRCGHQICCLECSQNITRCPVCSGECTFIRVYRA